MTVRDLLNKRRPAEQRLRLNLDGALAAEVAELRRQHAAALVRDAQEGNSLNASAPEIKRKLDELNLRLEDESALFVFRAMGRSRMADIIRRYPPTEDEWQRWRESFKTFPTEPPEFSIPAAAPEIISGSCVEPEMTPEEASQLWDELSDGEAAKLWKAAWSVNMEVSTRPTSGIGTDETLSSGPKSTTASNGESL